jgi:hypothetical protein
MDERINWTMSLQIIAIVVTMVCLPSLLVLAGWKWDQRRKKKEEQKPE